MQQDPNSLPALDGISPELAAGFGGAAFTVFLTFIFSFKQCGKNLKIPNLNLRFLLGSLEIQNPHFQFQLTWLNSLDPKVLLADYFYETRFGNWAGLGLGARLRTLTGWELEFMNLKINKFQAKVFRMTHFWITDPEFLFQLCLNVL